MRLRHLGFGWVSFLLPRHEGRAVSIPRQSRGLYDLSRSKRLGGPLTRPRFLILKVTLRKNT